MRPLRVHALIDSLTWGGAESLLADLADGAPGAGIELSVGYLQDVDGSPSAARLQARGIDPQLVGVHRLADPGAVLRVRRQLRRVRPDIVHTHLSAADVQGTLAARSLGLPAVSTVHLMAQGSTGFRRDDIKERLAAAVRRRWSARTITVSDAARAAYVASHGDRCGHVVTVHNGLSLQPPADGVGKRKRSQLGIPDDVLVVTIVSVLRPGRGHDLVADAVRRLLPRYPDLRVLVVGDGPSRAKVRATMAPLGDAALLLGHRDDVPELIAATDVLLHPTSMDAFPGVLLETAALGVPTVATAVGGIPEIVLDGRTGLLVPIPPTSAQVVTQLDKLLAQPLLRTRMGEAAQARFAERFAAPRWAGRLRVLYDDVLSTHRTA